jgi:hypothetical protein
VLAVIRACTTAVFPEAERKSDVAASEMAHRSEGMCLVAERFNSDRSPSTYIITRIDHVIGDADVFLDGTELGWFRYPIAKLTRVK